MPPVSTIEPVTKLPVSQEPVSQEEMAELAPDARSEEEAMPSASSSFLHSLPRLISRHLPHLRLWRDRRAIQYGVNITIILVSIGVHAVILMQPMEQKQQPKPPEEKQQVRIAQLPGKKKPNLAKKATPKPKVTVSRSLPPRPRPNPPPPRPKPSPEAPSADSGATQPDEAGSDTWLDFPKYPQATTGCFGLDGCSETGDALEQVAGFFTKELPAKKYTAAPIVTEPTRQAFQVTKGSLTQVLSVIADPAKGKVYIVLSDKPLVLSDLDRASEVPPEVFSVLQNLGADDADRTAFANPDLYFAGDRLRPDVLVTQIVEGQQASELMETFFRQNLINDGFEVSDPVGSYGGGDVYAITKGSLNLFVNLIPSKDGNSAIVVISKKPPS